MNTLIEKRKLKLTLAFAIAGALSACSTMPGQFASSGDTAAGSYLVANFAAQEGDVKSAAKFYADTLRQDPDNADVLARTFLYAATAGDMDRAISYAGQLAVQQPDNRAARLVLAVDAFGKKDYAVAATQIRQSAEGPFSSLTNSALLAWALAGQGDTDGALKTLAALQSQSGVQGLYAFHKALILEYAGRAEEAKAAYAEALSLMGTGPRIVDALGRFLEQHGDSVTAKALYTRVAQDNPDHPVAATGLARIAAGTQPASLIGSPADGAAEVLFGIAAALNEERSADVAIFYLNLTLYVRPDFDLARILLADHYETLGKYDIANALYAKTASSSPYRAMVDVQSAINDARLGQGDKAAGELRQLGEARPQDANVWTALGDVLRSSEKYAEAAAAYDKALAATPADDARRWSLYYARGIALERSKHWDDAERDLEEALKLKPDEPEVLNYLGYSWVDQGRNLKEAVAMLEKAHALRPLDGYITDSVGWAYFRLGRYKEATAALGEAVLLSPGDPTINDHLGDAYWKVGRKTEARFQWQHALSLEPGADQKPIIERKLEKGLDADAGGTS